MQTFIIERNVPGAGKLSHDEVRAIAQKSNETVASLGVPYHWHHSYAAGDKIYCVHSADSVEVIMEHARRGGFAADLVSVVNETFGPATAEAIAGRQSELFRRGYALVMFNNNDCAEDTTLRNPIFGVGPDVSEPELTRVTSTTGGAVFLAPDPAKVGAVFLRALALDTTN